MKFVMLALLLWFTAYSFGETDGAERQERISKAEMKLVQSRCDHPRAEKTP